MLRNCVGGRWACRPCPTLPAPGVSLGCPLLFRASESPPGSDQSHLLRSGEASARRACRGRPGGTGRHRAEGRSAACHVALRPAAAAMVGRCPGKHVSPPEPPEAAATASPGEAPAGGSKPLQQFPPLISPVFRAEQELACWKGSGGRETVRWGGGRPAHCQETRHAMDRVLASCLWGGGELALGR